jgi:GSH-dependent disulfide-bond oxidoreductase
MITVYSADTPNGIKIPIALEELNLPYRLMLNPNARIPALVDTTGPLGEEALFESGAILGYLGERYPGLLPNAADARLRALQWLTLQVAGLGPMFGQAGYFLRSAPQKIDFAIDRYVGEARRLTGVLEGRLAQATWLAGETYSIADIAHFGWLANPAYADVDLADYPRVRDWAAAIATRPAVQRARQRMQATPVGMAMSPPFAG